MPYDGQSELLRRAKGGELAAVAALFELHRKRLRRLIEIRLDGRLAGRVDPSDVLQDTFVDIQHRIQEYEEGDLPFYLWLRLRVGNRLTDLHRFHLRSQRRSAQREVSLCRGAMPWASSASLASQLLGKISTPSNAAIRAEMCARVQDALNGMEVIDREVLVLRHFEDLSNRETARVLGISPSAASNRYVRALGRLKSVIDSMDGISKGRGHGRD